MLALSLLFGGVTLVVMSTGMPISFALGFVAVAFMAVFMPASSLDTVTQSVYEEMASITLLSIPLFILKGRRSAVPMRGAICIRRCMRGCSASREV
jgi:TRAP-type mannitol/chloroaromatic compound transport system permease large subunit